MDNADWDSVFQYVSEPLDLDFSSEKSGTERADRIHLGNHITSQVPTPPVCYTLSYIMKWSL
jgi:hypothetical protein